MEHTLEIKWTVSRGRDTYGYNICTLYVDGRKAARCNGGGYDMEGTVLGDYVAKEYASRLLALTSEDMPMQHEYNRETKKRDYQGRYFYGLRYVDPKYDVRQAILTKCDDTFTKPEDVGKTLGQLQKEGKVVDLDMRRAYYKATHNKPTERHIVPTIDGACGKSSVERIMNAIGLELEYVPVRSKKLTVYRLKDKKEV